MKLLGSVVNSVKVTVSLFLSYFLPFFSYSSSFEVLSLTDVLKTVVLLVLPHQYIKTLDPSLVSKWPSSMFSNLCFAALNSYSWKYANLGTSWPFLLNLHRIHCVRNCIFACPRRAILIELVNLLH
jgi:hypothetical protein